MLTYAATTNAGKLEELRALFAGSRLDLTTFPGYDAPPEDADGYTGNAVLKAQALAGRLPGAGIAAAVLADDSGLEVDALHGRPGVYSARYGGADATWDTRRQLLLQELLAVPEAQRTARFVCAMALILPGGTTFTSLGTVDGFIAGGLRGDAGFGYDPLFFYPPLNRTFAQLTFDEKNAVSHRRAAADALRAQLDSHG
jgi:non-canonical purine NTP pyrophosphatase (RdgB/HAM1 family)